MLCIQAMYLKMDFYDYLTVECESGGQHTQKIMITGDLNSNILFSRLCTR